MTEQAKPFDEKDVVWRVANPADSHDLEYVVVCRDGFYTGYRLRKPMYEDKTHWFGPLYVDGVRIELLRQLAEARKDER
jgi:hypothetical protein